VDPLDAIWDRAVHTQRRRTWERGLDSAALGAYEEIVNRRVAQLTEILSARKSVDLARLFGRFA
jgi:cytochrome P450